MEFAAFLFRLIAVASVAYFWGRMDGWLQGWDEHKKFEEDWRPLLSPSQAADPDSRQVSFYHGNE